jgi:ATP-binding cassette subfamily B protein
VIDEGIAVRDLSRANLWSLAYLSVEMVRALVEAMQGYLLRAFSQATTGRIRNDVFGRMQRLPLRRYDEMPAGEISARSTNEVALLGDALSAGMVGLFRDTLALVLIITLVLALHPRFGAVVVGCSLVAAIPALLFRRTAQERSSHAVATASRMNSVFEENLSGAMVIRQFCLEGIRDELFRRESGRAQDVAFATIRMRSFFDGAATVTSAIALTLMLGLGGAELVEGRISAGLFVAFVQYGSTLLGSLRGTAEKALAVLSGIAAGGRVFETLDAEPALPVQRSLPEVRGEVRELAVEGLRFGYVPNKEVVRGVNLRIRPGERIALVGKTGAGKTTLARLLARLYDPWSGSVHLGGKDLRSFDLEDLRRKIAYVTQHVSIFRASVLENVRLGDPGIHRAQVERACREVGATSFIEHLPGAFDALIGEGGLPLSAGQRQLLSFARILVRHPDVLILDEPTANVDPTTEELVLRAMDRLLAATTSLVIAHRFSTLQGSDRVLVMRNGLLEEVLRNSPELESEPGFDHLNGG